MLNDNQKLVFRSLAENKALFAALKEFLETKFEFTHITDSQSNEQIGAIARARYEGYKVVQEAFKEIASCKSVENLITGNNPAR